ncbi:MAG: hypothetical protein KA165_09360 [Saprospiraceae bacterium]|nr:hypothetical protein [Saprospiraceae bacterium]
MNHFSPLLKYLTLMKWLGLAALFGCNADHTTSKGSVASGPFEICWEVTESRSGSWFNNGGNFNARQYTSWFSIKHGGTLVKVPAFDKFLGTPMEGTAKEKPLEYFWQALFLKDAPRPAILAGIHSMYLITEENGQVKITPLHEQDGDFATYQWLDSDNGQPGPMNSVYLGDDSGNSRFLAGGRYLMVNSKVVLDVQTLEIYPFDLITYEVLQKLDDYHAGNSFVAQLSPQKTQMVLVGNRDNPANRLLYQYGLVVIDFKKNTAYAVPFDRTDTRFFSIWDASREWLDTYFEWTTDKAGEEHIVLRKFKQLPYWQGRWSTDDTTGDTVEYKLMPVQESMLPVFLDFVRKEVTVKEETTDKTPHYETGSPDEPASYLVYTLLHMEDGDLEVYSNPEEQTIRLRADNKSLLKQIGGHFDMAMLEGKFQEYFGRYE